jgi:Ice-binding-like
MNIIGGRSVLSHVNYSWPAAALVLAVTIAALVASAPAASGAVAAVGLGTAGSFGVLSGSTVTNTGQSVVHGDLGVSPGTAVTGFAPGIVTGAEHRADGVAAGAQSDLTTAYNVAAGESPSGSVGPFLGAGATIVAGVYNATTSLDVGGALTLDGQGNPDAVFIFQVGSKLVTDSASDVILINGAQACHVFWQVGSSATIGTHSAFQGSVLALQSVSVQAGDTINGRMLARNGTATLDDDTITVPGCTAAPTPPLPPPARRPRPHDAGPPDAHAHHCQDRDVAGAHLAGAYSDTGQRDLRGDRLMTPAGPGARRSRPVNYASFMCKRRAVYAYPARFNENAAHSMNLPDEKTRDAST